MITKQKLDAAHALWGGCWRLLVVVGCTSLQFYFIIL